MYLVCAELLIYVPSLILDQGLSFVEVTSQEEQKEIVPLFNVHFSSLTFFSLLLTS